MGGAKRRDGAKRKVSEGIACSLTDIAKATGVPAEPRMWEERCGEDDKDEDAERGRGKRVQKELWGRGAREEVWMGCPAGDYLSIT